MKLRSYHTDSVETAIRMAGIELGDQAVFLGSKRAADTGPYEVTFALVDAPAGAAGELAKEASAVLAAAVQLEGDRVADEMAAGHWRKFAPPEPPAESIEIKPGVDMETQLREPASGPTFRTDRVEQPPPGRGELPARSWKGQQEKQRQLSQSVDELSQSVGELRAWLEQGQAWQETVLPPHGEVLEDPLRAAVFTELTRQGVRSNVVLELLTDLVSDDGAAVDLDAIRRRFAERLERLCPLDASLGVGADGPRIVVLVGPPGAGKTSTIAKLAVRHGLSEGSAIEFITADWLRVGGAESLEAYARLFGSRCTQLSGAESLPAALDEARDRAASSDRSLIFIDTPGYGRSDWGHAERLAECLKAMPGVDVHLVLSLNTKPADLRRTIDSYRIFDPSKLLFTRLDETETCGVALNEALRTKCPLSFFANGTRVPEDLAPVNAVLLSRLLLRRSPMTVE